MGKQHWVTYERLRRAIVEGRIAPGVRLTEEQVAARADVSRTPVREALQRLASEGFLIARRTGHRTELIVTPLTESDVAELYYAVGALESVVARGVAALTLDDAAQLAARMREAHDAFRHAREEGSADPATPFLLHNDFHDTLVRTLAGKRLQSMIEQLRPHVQRYEWIYAPVVGPPHDVTFTEHEAIIAAVASRDADAAETSVERNWRNSADRLLAAFRRSGPRGDWLLD